MNPRSSEILNSRSLHAVWRSCQLVHRRVPYWAPYVTVCCLAGRTHTRTHVGEGLDNRMRATMFFIRYSSDLYIFTILQNTEIKLVLQSHFNMKCFVHITQQTHTANSNISWRLWLSPGQLIK